MASLAEIRAKLKAQETRSERGTNGGDNAIYIRISQKAVLRYYVFFRMQILTTHSFGWNV
jgi:hypothetical protein